MSSASRIPDSNRAVLISDLQATLRITQTHPFHARDRTRARKDIFRSFQYPLRAILPFATGPRPGLVRLRQIDHSQSFFRFINLPHLSMIYMIKNMQVSSFSPQNTSVRSGTKTNDSFKAKTKDLPSVSSEVILDLGQKEILLVQMGNRWKEDAGDLTDLKGILSVVDLSAYDPLSLEHFVVLAALSLSSYPYAASRMSWETP
ncbi:uncharacterized protein BT62DRAFT_995715 [Guyanagaster necrorhizus]|uniref:Uncharacterized protein n=1 Tax=Guyanagaster necrorhizus TaxID=856835 RepID=A0A9P8AQ22_9AGAR|nr:uncharacterized protein BT62DRAFT_995715 [Guyanagaster necrorhizus MCA 3950]KAG7443928.1 hypothetical protein BT62DRAFT_995715 [Guyanagaster necrorhizus MCA 3950]